VETSVSLPAQKGWGIEDVEQFATELLQSEPFVQLEILVCAEVSVPVSGTAFR